MLSGMRRILKKDRGTSKKRSITIDLSKNTVKNIYHVNDLTDEEVGDLWLTPMEFMETKKQYTIVVRMMMKSRVPLPETEQFSCRGLEFRTKEGSRNRKRSKRKAVAAVLLEQEIQREEGVYDSDFIRDAYTDVTGSSSLDALNRGLKDQKAIVDLLYPEDRMEFDLRQGPKKSVDIPKPRRSFTETLNGSELRVA